MTRAQELRKLLLEVEAGEWPAIPPDMLSVKIITILAGGTGNYRICEQILLRQADNCIEKEEANNGTHAD